MANDVAPLHPADPDDVRQTLAFALTFDGRRRFQPSGEMMARITAAHLVEHLERCGFVVMERSGREDFAGIARGARSKDLGDDLDGSS
jgi:hypothetical protein